MAYFFEVIKALQNGALVSIKIFFVTMIVSLPMGILLAVLRHHYRKSISKIIQAYTWLFRGTPLMLQLFFFMYGLPQLNIQIDRMMVAYVGFGLNYAAYFTEIIRSGIESIPTDQFEAGMVEGAKKGQLYRYIILPQAIRKELPVITSELITLIKDTALVTVIAVSDLMRNVKEIVSRDFTITPFFIASLFYLFISFVIVKILSRIENKFDYQ